MIYAPICPLRHCGDCPKLEFFLTVRGSGGRSNDGLFVNACLLAPQKAGTLQWTLVMRLGNIKAFRCSTAGLTCKKQSDCRCSTTAKSLRLTSSNVATWPLPGLLKALESPQPHLRTRLRLASPG